MEEVLGSRLGGVIVPLSGQPWSEVRETDSVNLRVGGVKEHSFPISLFTTEVLLSIHPTPNCSGVFVRTVCVCEFVQNNTGAPVCAVKDIDEE